LAELAESLNFAALDKIYVPTNIPEPYRLYGISIYEDGVGLRYLREEDLASEYKRQLTYVTFQFFDFYFSRLNTKDDLTDGKDLLCGTNRLEWVFDGRSMSMHVPASIDVYANEISLIEYLGLDSVDDLAQFVEVNMIELD